MFSSEHDLLDKINSFTIQRNKSCNVSNRKELNRELVGLRRELKNLRCNPVLPVTKPERNTVTTIFEIYRKIQAFLEGEQPSVIIERESMLLIKEHLERIPFSGPYRDAPIVSRFNSLDVNLSQAKALSVHYATVLELLIYRNTSSLSQELLESIAKIVDSLYCEVITQLHNAELLDRTIETLRVYSALLTKRYQS